MTEQNPRAADRAQSAFHALLVDPNPDRRWNLACGLKAMGAEAVAEITMTHSARMEKSVVAECDLVLLHSGQATDSAAETVADLRRHGGERVLVIASEREPAPAIAAFAANAVGYLIDRSDPAQVDGPVARPSPRDEKLVRGEHDTPAQRLSAREIEILSLVAEGKSNREISVDLALSANTVKGHLARVSKKLQTGDRSRMVLLALRAGVIS
ncbi:LuxR C-terminal-related transcriptional regulator [Amycolatopsis keratiniphila]|uniref:LuxR family transcriptional regulator n=1 Tax=Amycolatopsis keratiniphila TaxID=129921 RepID=R4T6K9_9PSEU|nr:LuxR C-terminal-related transcriptional regulator [Amycolatopsis keratiniphila]AGM08021.1 LuxR family transcriptional regulator [Amycolatopsis keratiniphila]